MEGDMAALIKVTFYTSASMTYARFASSLTHPGFPRLLSLLPVLLLLPSLPFSFSSLHLRGISAFFLSWLALFKLLLLSFNLGPLSPSLPLLPFLATASLPVKLRTTSSSKSKSKSKSPFLIQFTLLLFLISLYKHKNRIHPYLLLALYSCHVYLALEIVLAAAAFLASALLGLDLEPQFDAPFKSTSLQDFWGRRWNLMVTGVLRPAVYVPVRARCGAAAGVIVTFLVSGAMHEVMFCYLTLAGPTGEVFCFFALHGVCTAVEKWAEKGKWYWRRPHPMVSVPMAVGFVAVTGFWLFFPPILRSGVDDKVLEECAAAVGFLADRVTAVFRRLPR